MKSFSPRFAFFIAFLIVACIVGTSIFLEMIQGINPCMLCLVQRAIFILLGSLFLIGSLVSSLRAGKIVISFLSIVASALGIFIAGRQVWLQHNPHAATGNCDVSLQYMIQVLPLNEVIKKIIHGGAECAQVGWQFLHLSLAEWSLISFILFAIFSLWQLFRR